MNGPLCGIDHKLIVCLSDNFYISNCKNREVMRMQPLWPLLITLALSGCVTMGGIADHLDPVEAQLVKRLASELCKVNFTYQSEIIKTETVRAAFVGVADIQDIGDDEGRVASIMVKGNQQSLTYNPVTAMAYCGYSSTSKSPSEKFTFLLNALA